MTLSVVPANRKKWTYMNEILELESVGLRPLNLLWLSVLQEWEARHIRDKKK